MKTHRDLVDRLRARAFCHSATIVFSDGTDPRVLKAAAFLTRTSCIHPVLIGDATAILSVSRAFSEVPDIEIYDPVTDFRQEYLCEIAYGRNKIRRLAERTGMSLLEILRDPVLSAALFVQAGFADGMVGGADVPTAKVIRAGIRAVGLDSTYPVVSGSFAMIIPKVLSGGQRVLVFGDSAVVPRPTPVQLGLIALNTAHVAKTVIGLEPVVALLSFSTKGSAEDESVNHVRETLSWLHVHASHLNVDGELQADAALIPEIGQQKAPGSAVAGRANVLIFPNLAAGNIAYKLVERVAGATAIGVILSGLARPINDLSRGCSIDDIINMAAITVLQALSEDQATAEVRGKANS